MRVALTKVEGVESVSVSLQRATADVQLRAGNRVTLAQIRQLVKDNGFVPREATVTVVGSLIERGGKPAVDVSNLGSVWLLVEDAKQGEAYATARRLLLSALPRPVEITGTVPAPAAASAPEQLAVQAVRRLP